ncbi:MAG: Outer membrane protein assembly factor BamA precursor [Spirochaetes bacterium ADurb.Bin315]|nr:MAG: Outer membrane protein assembly factor BamA precursor [Spirochaetes bacterium ADurb.Bin315]HOE88911.1 outer membrane protein assembly factor BamA [Sphaerochaeta sp.]HOR79927.1 outer membrane protein assembly factor BamA [Sphaerochaeta sp.]
MKSLYRRILWIALLILLATVNIFASDAEPWYMGRPIASFVNTGLLNVRESEILDIQYEYLRKPFSDQLFNELQSKLYALEYFYYFLADAERTGEGGNELSIVMHFEELPYVNEVLIEGNSGLKTKDILGASLVQAGSFFDEYTLTLSRDLIEQLYREKGYINAQIERTYTEDEATNTVSILFEIEEGSQSRIGEIAFEGVHSVPPASLAKQLESKSVSLFNPGYYNPLLEETDKKAIIQYYQNRGYIDVEVGPAYVEDISSDDDKYTRLRLVYPIAEGSQWFFGGIEVSGNEVFSDEQFQNLISIKTGSVLDLSRIQAQIAALTDLYWNNGYIFNLISSDEVRNEENKTITYRLHVQENRQAIIEDVRIEGITRSKPYVFERELAFKKGDIFSKELLIKSAQNIYNTLIVTDVQFDILNGTEEGTVIPVFTVTEGNQMDLQFGATFGGNVDGFPVSGFLQWSNKNLGGTGRDLSVSTNLSPDTQTVMIAFQDDWFRSYRWSNGFTFSFERSVKENTLTRGQGSGYFTTSTSANTYPNGYESYQAYQAAGQAYPTADKLMEYVQFRFSLGYNTGYTFMFRPGALSIGVGVSIGLNKAEYDKAIYDPYEWLIKQYGEKWQFSNRLSLTFAWDGRDRIENTSRGYYISETFTYAGGILFGLSNYMRTTTSLSGYLTLFSFQLEEKPANVVLGMTTTVGAMLPQFHNPVTQDGEQGWGWYDAKMGATRYEMLYLDGMNTARGFPVVFDQAFLWDTQLSVSWPLVHNVLSAELYISASGVSQSLKETKMDQLAWYFSAGGGIKLKVPGFPLGLYLVKNATYIDNTFAWDTNHFLFRGQNDTSGLKLILAITTTLY